MNCGEVRALISAYHDGEATPEERKTVERHLATCEDCRTTLAEYRSIGGDLRLMPLPVPPAGLRRDVWRAIEARQGTSRALPRLGSPGANLPRLGQAHSRNPRPGMASIFTYASNGWAKALPVALLLGAFMVVLSFVIFRSNITAAAVRLEENAAIFDYGQAVHVVFTKSVIGSDAEGNTRVDEIVGSGSQVVPCNARYIASTNIMEIWPQDKWKAGSSYRITINAQNIRQPLGNEPLAAAPIELTFMAAAHTPTATNTATDTPVPTSTPTGTATPVPPSVTPQPTQGIINAGRTPQPANSTVAAPPTPTGPSEQMQAAATATARALADSKDKLSATATAQAMASAARNTPVPSATAIPSATPVAPTRVPVAPSATVTAQVRPTNTLASTNTATAQPTQTHATVPTVTPYATGAVSATSTATATATRPAPSVTSSPTGIRKATATPTTTMQPKVTPGKGTPTATIVATPTPGGCLLLPVRGFGKVWHDNAPVRARIGCATRSEDTIDPAAEQHFQGGYMFWKGDTHMIYVFVGDSEKSGVWSEFKDTWVEGKTIPQVGPPPPPGTYLPIRGFGKVWAGNDALRQALGYALDQETTIEAVWQPFEHGLAFWIADRSIRFLYEDGRWEHYTDAFQSDNEPVSSSGF